MKSNAFRIPEGISVEVVAEAGTSTSPLEMRYYKLFIAEIKTTSYAYSDWIFCYVALTDRSMFSFASAIMYSYIVAV